MSKTIGTGKNKEQTHPFGVGFALCLAVHRGARLRTKVRSREYGQPLCRAASRTWAHPPSTQIISNTSRVRSNAPDVTVPRAAASLLRPRNAAARENTGKKRWEAIAAHSLATLFNCGVNVPTTPLFIARYQRSAAATSPLSGFSGDSSKARSAKVYGDQRDCIFLFNSCCTLIKRKSSAPMNIFAHQLLRLP